MKICPKNIKLFFSVKSSCCQSSESKANPCRNSAQITEPLDYLRALHSKTSKNCWHVTTITIGTKWLGRMAAEHQYDIFVKKIKRHIPYHHKTKKYIYHFELTESGQLHAHGIEYNTCQNEFIESFQDFGSRNCHKKSFQELRNFEGYTKYIDKDNTFPSITNIKKSDMVTVSEAKEEGSPQGLRSEEECDTEHCEEKVYSLSQLESITLALDCPNKNI